jgi:transmembrane sensor
MSPRRPSEPNVDEQAARFENDLANATPQTRQGLARWLRRSPEHVAAFLRHKMLSTELEGLDPERRIDVNSFVARAKSVSTIVEWPGPTPQPVEQVVPSEPASQRKIGRVSWRAIAAAAAIGAVAMLWAFADHWGEHWMGPHPAIYRTDIGQHRQLRLPDGSVIDLNTQSTVQIQFTRAYRDVYLLSGEALFAVHHDATLPFRVHVGATVIQDVGTQFSVRRAEGLTTVSVLEGSVQVSADHAPPDSATLANRALEPATTLVVASQDYQRLTPNTKLAAGEQMHIVADGTLMQRQRVDVSQATAWRQGRLVFSEATLEEIVSEFNRYNERQILLVGDAHRGRRYSGVFDAIDPRSFLEYLRRDDGGLVIESDAEALVIRGQPDRAGATTP